MSFLKKNKSLNRPSHCRVPGVYIMNFLKKKNTKQNSKVHSIQHTPCVFHAFPLVTRIPAQLPEHAAWGLFSFQGFTLIHSHQLPLRASFGNVPQTLQTSTGKSSSALNLKITYLRDVYHPTTQNDENL